MRLPPRPPENLARMPLVSTVPLRSSRPLIKAQASSNARCDSPCTRSATHQDIPRIRHRNKQYQPRRQPSPRSPALRKPTQRPAIARRHALDRPDQNKRNQRNQESTRLRERPHKQHAQREQRHQPAQSSPPTPQRQQPPPAHHPARHQPPRQCRRQHHTRRLKNRPHLHNGPVNWSGIRST